MLMRFHPYFGSVTYRSGSAFLSTSLRSQRDRSTFALSSFTEVLWAASQPEAEQAEGRRRCCEPHLGTGLIYGRFVPPAELVVFRGEGLLVVRCLLVQSVASQQCSEPGNSLPKHT